MAQIDFTNAHIECINPNFVFNNMINAYRGYLMMGELNFVTGNGSDANITAVTNGKNIITNVTTKGFSIIKSGTTTASGDRIILRATASSTPVWRIFDISFDSDDTFDFQIDVIVNTT